ncbi:hypothetical protein [Tenacibaculum amylolyticum]|uniref:hypothetical protein n=1 Tax=Tenacibaculum amylolyticum TaxID=104269 RepID=UPI0038934A5B
MTIEQLNQLEALRLETLEKAKKIFEGNYSIQIFAHNIDTNTEVWKKVKPELVRVLGDKQYYSAKASNEMHSTTIFSKWEDQPKG